MFFPFLDPTFILLIPAVILAIWAQSKVSGAYRKYSRLRNSAGITGAQVARRILDQYGLQDIEVQAVQGRMSDHYDPVKRVLRLSSENYESPSIAAMAIAAHESGHALQHAEGYAALKFRHAMVAPVNIGSTLAFPLFFIGLIFASPTLMDVGIVFFSLAVLFHMVTLPVELDASRRAVRILSTDGYILPEEAKGAKRMLSAAAWTYVAAATMAVLQLLRLVLLRGMFGGDD